MKSVNYHLSSCRWTGKKERFPRNLWQKRFQAGLLASPVMGSKKSTLFFNLEIHEFLGRRKGLY